MMPTLFHCVSARSYRVLWMLEELGLTYELKMLPFPPRAMAREYLQLNPLGTIPALFDGDVRMTESVAICQYLVGRYGPSTLQVQPAEADFGAYLNWLHFGEATLTFPQTLILRYSKHETEERRLPQVVQDYTRWFLARLRAIDAVLSKSEFMCAGRFTVADVSVGYAIMLATLLDLEPQLPVAVRDYWSRLQQRPAFQRAMQAQDRAARDQGVSAVPAPLCFESSNRG